MKKNIIYSILAATLLLSACSTKLDVVGDYKETLVVYGLLDQGADTQYVKINKAFLGPGSAFTYAQIKDSTQFTHALNVKITRLSDNIDFYLSPANNYIPKDPGIFYAPDQTNVIYKLYTDNRTHGGIYYPRLSATSDYKLTVTDGETGTKVTGTTSLVPDVGSFSKPVSGTTFSFVIVGYYPNYPFPIEWTSAKNASLYQAIVRLNYVDSTTTGNVAHTIDYTFPQIKTAGLDGGEVLGCSFPGATFYQYIGNTLSDYSGLLARIPGNVDILLLSGSDDLNTFIEVNTPSTGIVQDKPEFTNITGGLGLFSSRYNKAPFSKPLSGTSLDSLSGGQYTCRLRFLNNVHGAGVWTGCH